MKRCPVDIEQEWTSHCREIKESLWGISPQGNESPGWLYAWKFQDGEVRDGWSYASLLEWFWQDAKKTSTRDAYTTTDRYKVRRDAHSVRP